MIPPLSLRKIKPNLLSRNSHRNKSPYAFEYYSKEDLYKLVLSLKIEVNNLTQNNKKLKTKLACLKSKSSKLKISSTNPNFSPETDKKKLFSAAAEFQQENKALRKELIFQHKLITEMLKNPQNSDMNEIYKSRNLKSLLANKVNTQSQKNFKLQKISLNNSMPKFYIQSELETVSEILKELISNAKGNNLELEEIWYVMNPNDLKYITIREFTKGARALNLKFNESELSLFFKFFSEEKEVLSKNEFIEALKSS